MGGVGLVGDAGGVQLGRWGGLGFVKTRMDAGAHTLWPRAAPRLSQQGGEGAAASVDGASQRNGGENDREGGKQRGGAEWGAASRARVPRDAAGPMKG